MTKKNGKAMSIDGATIKLSKEDWNKCFDFSTKCFPTTEKHYNKREKSRPEKKILDHAQGKFAELGVYKFLTDNLKNYNLECTYPDFNVYENKNKSFDPDIKILNLGSNIHVKSCRVNGWDSWIFQLNGKGTGHTDNIIFSNDINNYIVFCFVDADKYEIKVIGMMQADFVRKKELYKNPKKLDWVATKRAVYYDDIKNFDKETLWSFVIQARNANL